MEKRERDLKTEWDPEGEREEEVTREERDRQTKV